MLRVVAALSLLLSPIAAFAADWPQWRGPHRDGKSTEAVEPWQGEPATLWRLPVGEGHSSPVVAGGRIFVHSKVKGEEKEEVIAYDVATGKQIWRMAYERGPYKNEYGNGPRATPLVDGDRVYTLGVTGILACWEAASGKERWKVEILKTFQAPNLFFGVSASPVIDGDRLLVLVGAPQAAIVAFDKLSGKVLWKSGDDKATYASPIVLQMHNQPLGLFLTSDGLTAINPQNGQRHWQFPLKDRLAESSTTPVAVGDVVFASSVTFGGVGLKLTESSGQPGYEQMWKNEKLTCYFSTPVAVGEHLYMVTGQFLPVPAAHLHCVEAKTGKVLWTHKNVGKYHATVMLAKDRLLLLEEEGNLALVEPNPKEYKELGRAKVCGHTWAHPALNEGRLILRDDKELIGLQLAKAPGKATTPAKPADAMQTRIDQIAQPIMEEKKTLGVVVGIINKEGRRVFGYGKLAADSEKRPDGDTVFEIGSITKVFTALALAEMAEEGIVGLNDPVQKYLPDTVTVPKRGEQELTLLHLATHTSGLPRVPIALTLKNPKNPYADITTEQVYDFLSHCKLLHDVGSKFAYSNLGGGLLGNLLATKAGKSYEALIAERIAKPLGMQDTCITLAAEQKARLAAGYQGNGKLSENWDFQALAGAGALRSTVNDMLRFAAANLDPPASRLGEAITACQQPRHASDAGQVGLGWMISKPPGTDRVIIWHNGGTGGYCSYLAFHRATGTAVVVLTNSTVNPKGSTSDVIGGKVLELLIEGGRGAE